MVIVLQIICVLLEMVFLSSLMKKSCQIYDMIIARSWKTVSKWQKLHYPFLPTFFLHCQTKIKLFYSWGPFLKSWKLSKMVISPQKAGSKFRNNFTFYSTKFTFYFYLAKDSFYSFCNHFQFLPHHSNWNIAYNPLQEKRILGTFPCHIWSTKKIIIVLSAEG